MAKWTLPDMIPRAEGDRMAQEAVAAALMEAAEKIAVWLEEYPWHRSLASDILALIPTPALAALKARDARVREAERERCAKVAEGDAAGPYVRIPAFHGVDGCSGVESDIAQVSRAIAAAIREGGK